MLPKSVMVHIRHLLRENCTSKDLHCFVVCHHKELIGGKAKRKIPLAISESDQKQTQKLAPGLATSRGNLTAKKTNLDFLKV